MRVLIVEDDPDLSRQLKLALADAGYAVDHAPDGEEAQFLGENEPYDAIVLAVAHDQFTELGPDAIRAFGGPKAVLFDVKSVLPKEAADLRL